MRIPFTKKEFRLFSLSDMDKAMDLLVVGRETATGVKVTNNTALNCVPYFAGVRLISETIGQLPLIEYRRLEPRGKERATDRILYRLLHDAPNPEMSAISFKETMQGHLITWGNAFAEIQWNPDGYPEALWPLRPDMMRVGRDEVTKEIIYAYRLPDGTTVRLPAYRVFHIPGFGFDGLIGYDTIYLAREAIGMALAMEEYGARFFGNGANPGGVLEHPNVLKQDAQDRLRKNWNDMHQGLSNQHRIAILEEGMKYHQVGIPPENAQFLESRKFQLGEIARLLHIPPHMIGDLERATFSNIEHQAIEYVTHTITPWFVRWEQTCNRKLLLPFERGVFFFEFLSDALLRGDTAARASFYKELFYMGAMSPNDIREKENLNPIDDDGADKYYVQQNMIPMELAGKLPKALPPPAPDADKIDDAVRNIADRDKKNVLAAYRRDPQNFDVWLDDYYRDFKEYMSKEITSAIGNGHRED
jgi:HK97 family phage portal protein